MPSDPALARLRKLTTPHKVQDFLNSLHMRKESLDVIVRSPLAAIAQGEASCMEGALIAVAALQSRGYEPRLLDLKVAKNNRNDVDHVVTIFREHGRYGAISKTNHGVLRYREPVYASVRELAMSYFHEYFTDGGAKTLRTFSKPFDVFRAFGDSWIESADDLFEIACALDDSPHKDMLPATAVRTLRLADPVEIEAGTISEWEGARSDRLAPHAILGA